jgi:hypothetical protein
MAEAGQLLLNEDFGNLDSPCKSRGLFAI